MFNIYLEQYGYFVKIIEKRKNKLIAIRDAKEMQDMFQNGTYAVASSRTVHDLASWKKHTGNA